MFAPTNSISYANFYLHIVFVLLVWSHFPSITFLCLRFTFLSNCNRYVCIEWNTPSSSLHSIASMDSIDDNVPPNDDHNGRVSDEGMTITWF